MFKSSSDRLRAAADDDAGPAAAGRQGVLDATALDKLRQLDPDGSRGFLVQVLATYLQSLERHLGRMPALRAEGAVKSVGDAAHTLKSSSASVGALALAKHCAVVEGLARAGDTRALGDPLAGLMEEGARVAAVVRAMLPA
jgi:HPt (histidine-containing phosphotransfer) domain-containing protein